MLISIMSCTSSHTLRASLYAAAALAASAAAAVAAPAGGGGRKWEVEDEDMAIGKKRDQVSLLLWLGGQPRENPRDRFRLGYISTPGGV